MKKLLILLFAVIGVNAFALEENPKCGLKMHIVDVEGPALPGCYQVVHIMVTNPTDTVAYTPDNVQLATWQLRFNKETGIQDYAITGEYKEELILEPGEEKMISINAQVVKEPDGWYYQVVGLADFGSHVDQMDEYFCRMVVEVQPYRDWDLSIDICAEGLVEEDGESMLFANEVNTMLSLCNNESEVFTPQTLCYELRRSIPYGPKIKNYYINYLYLKPGEVVKKNFSFDGLEDGKTYYVVLYNTSGMVPTENMYLCTYGPFTVDTTVGVGNICPETTGCDAIYDLQGRKLNSEPERGIYIKNGRKVAK